MIILSGKKYKNFIFDLDGTLVETWTATPLEDRVERITYLMENSYNVGIVTNQGGVGLGIVDKLDTLNRIMSSCESLGLPESTPVAVCWSAPESNDPRRKPSGTMILEVIEELQASAHNTVYVGDLDSDRIAAEDAGIDFLWADEFFDLVA